MSSNDNPLEAIREAVINALMHRDYFFTGSNIYFYIYSNRIEVINPGGLFKLKYEELGKRASRRNELIADLFFRAGFGEKMGGNILTMPFQRNSSGFIQSSHTILN